MLENMTNPAKSPRSASSSGPSVALLGLGTMGQGMARNIARAGLPLTVWNRSRDKTEVLADTGAAVAGSPAEAVAGADLVVTMLFDRDSVADVMRQAAERLSDGAIWVQMSTVGVDGAAHLADLAAELGVQYVDAPVLGTRKPAADGALVVLASGPAELRDRCAPLLDAVGARTLWVGEAGAGSRLKLVANAWVLCVMEGISESLNLAKALGLDPALFLEAVQGGAMDAPYVKMKGNSILAEDYAPAFALSGAAKDAALIIDAARGAGTEMAVTEVALRYLRRGIEAGHGDKDMSATYLVH